MNLSELFGKTAEKKCPCCGGVGEHDSGFECYLCDAGKTVPDGTPADAKCDGRLSDGGHSKTAAEDPGVHRGLSIVLPPHIHKMVHDSSQPQAARAHLLLSEIRKQKEGHQGEEDATGAAGGLGSFWSPHQHKAEEYATQSGFGAYKEHELEHNCGDPDYGDGGCPTTRVVVHAQTPHEKHHWKEIFRPGEQYDPEISWRLPVRPGTQMRVRGISWREGNDHKPSSEKYSDEGMAAEKAPYQSHDFLREVRKQASYAPPGTMGKDSEGHRVQMTTMDGWAHDDGSHGHEDNTTINDKPVYTQDHTWLPEGRYWGPNSAQNDQRLFEGDHLRPEVREDILGRINSFMRLRYKEWPSWTKVYFAGSEAARWQPFNGDFDILMGMDFDKFRQANPEYDDQPDDAIAKTITDGMWRTINVDGYWFTLADGRKVGPFDRTFFVNPKAWDIRNLNPYAAYDVTDDQWAVHPLEVPKDWDATHLPESYWTYAEAVLNEIKAIGTLPPEERHRMAANLWEELHTHRSDAFNGDGKGIFDLSNVIEKYLDQHPDKPWEQLVQWKSQAPSGPEPWVPTTTKRTLSMLFGAKKDDSGDFHDSGMMVALVPPKSVAKKLLVEDGEPLDALHVTLVYLGKTSEYSRKQMDELEPLVRAWARTQKPLTAKIGGAGTFYNPSEHVLMAHVDIPYGGGVRHSLSELLEEHGYNVRNDHGWTPHITLKYHKHPVRFLPKVEPQEWKASEVVLCIGGTWTPMALGS